MAFCSSTAVSFGLGTTSFVQHSVHRTRRRAPAVRLRRSARTVASAAAGADDEQRSRGGEREGRSDDGSRDAEFAVDTTKPAEGENELYEFVKSVPPPQLVAKFTEAAPPVVQGAIRQTLMRMLGSLPPLAFSTTVSTMSPNLVQLFHSCLISGYMFRNAAYRLELTRSLERSDLPALPARESTPEIKGGVAVFTEEDGSKVEIPVEEYVAELRSTVDSLKGELQRERKGGNELLSFLATMEPSNLEALTANAGEEVVDAMKRVVDAVTVSQGINENDDKMVTASSFELGQLLFYLMVNGFFLREAEVRVELQRKLEGKSVEGKFLEGDSTPPPKPEV